MMLAEEKAIAAEYAAVRRLVLDSVLGRALDDAPERLHRDFTPGRFHV
jgi:hypothetical protein